MKLQRFILWLIKIRISTQRCPYTSRYQIYDIGSTNFIMNFRLRSNIYYKIMNSFCDLSLWLEWSALAYVSLLKEITPFSKLWGPHIRWWKSKAIWICCHISHDKLNVYNVYECIELFSLLNLIDNLKNQVIEIWFYITKKILQDLFSLKL